MGLVPRTARSGDQVCVILGGSQLLLLRPLSSGQYQVVGPCYIHGFHYGEALLGPIPDHFEFVRMSSEDTKDMNDGYIDQRTGKPQFSDPRIDWTQEEINTMTRTSLVFPDGTEQPIMTHEMLERRGVVLQEFDLV